MGLYTTERPPTVCVQVVTWRGRCAGCGKPGCGAGGGMGIKQGLQTHVEEQSDQSTAGRWCDFARTQHFLQRPPSEMRPPGPALQRASWIVPLVHGEVEAQRTMHVQLGGMGRCFVLFDSCPSDSSKLWPPTQSWTARTSPVGQLALGLGCSQAHRAAKQHPRDQAAAAAAR